MRLVCLIILLVRCSFLGAQRNQEGKYKEIKKVVRPFICVTPNLMPEYPGGLQAMYHFIAENIQLPCMMEFPVNGTCYIRFVIEANGKVGKIEVQKGIKNCSQLDAECIRVVKLLQSFIPAKTNGVSVPVWFQLPIKIKIP